MTLLETVNEFYKGTRASEWWGKKIVRLPRGSAAKIDRALKLKLELSELRTRERVLDEELRAIDEHFKGILKSEGAQLGTAGRWCNRWVVVEKRHTKGYTVEDYDWEQVRYA
jgi:hypothetical protein